MFSFSATGIIFYALSYYTMKAGYKVTVNSVLNAIDIAVGVFTFYYVYLVLINGQFPSFIRNFNISSFYVYFRLFNLDFFIGLFCI